MTITKNKVVIMHYTLKDDDGQVIDSSEGRDPLAYLHGARNIVVGLENALEGKDAGEKLSVVVAPSEGYGEYNEELKQEVPLAQFDDASQVQPGAQFHAQTPQGVVVATVLSVENENAVIDMNHALAGQNLNFDVEVVEVRDATAEELQHGHAHAPGGHQH
jgi:FKBP-type peptidyl-prolyl cis-trans isomerase SlyD